ncbi:MAG: DUF4197 domain-containing protein [Cytophagaceae bacterium]|nr:DUF4197 domain-containing protein [Cytophagaceae bacterium]MDW8457450.1 DUF4197 domain-containing protein [Cytophagaceae bacterium]
MKNKLASLILCSMVPLSVVAQIDLNKIKNTVQNTVSGPTKVNQLTEAEIIQGLKEALTKGSNTASAELNRTDGYNKNPRVRIPFPEDAAKIAATLRSMGFGKKVDEFELTLNRSAEQAAKEAAPIFVNAIKQMTFADAKSILTGPDTAATQYLRKTTYNNLYNAFSPHISKALGNNLATQKWTELATIYNKLPTTKEKIQTDLVKFTTHKALKGLFILVADEEMKIRKDPLARTTDILKKVFGATK